LKAEVFAQVSEHTGQLINSDPPPTDAKGFWGDLSTSPGRYVVYLGVSRLTVNVSIACDGRTAAGTLTGWTSSRAGILECAVTPPAQRLATEAKKLFCAGK
jgi:hypothetical protein